MNALQVPVPAGAQPFVPGTLCRCGAPATSVTTSVRTENVFLATHLDVEHLCDSCAAEDS